MVACAFNALAAAIKFEPQIERINADKNGTDWAHRWDVLISVNPRSLRLFFYDQGKRGRGNHWSYIILTLLTCHLGNPRLRSQM